MGDRLKGQIAIISGGARGIGAATARLFAAEGAVVVVGDVLTDAGTELVTEIGSQATFVPLDVSVADNWDHIVETCMQKCGFPSILINNAGIIGSNTHIRDLSEAEFRRVMEVNLIGTFLGTRAVINSMSSRGGGSIVNVSSNAGFVGAAGLAAYTTSKFAIRGLTKAAALEVGPLGIRVNSVHPGSIDTELVDRPDNPEMFNRQAISRIGQPIEIARLILFVASDESSFSTGSEFVADGGFLAGTASPGGASVTPDP
jgi:3alpha(or 20beta)-hydroxysteroid dehydrogenase